ncbi:hypothetical protein O4H61_07990 [Roseovarius aestuarii]|nr:hypothetical protein [Roseovarius aestuarii]
MVSTSKILTVSYGTFSCTLEGFDDSFDTMKAIAEYFRDLAADDRYFGAEPPSPDAEMLARIAEREIARRVEAHSTDGRIHLRAGPAPALEAAAQNGAAVENPAMSTAQDMAAALPQETQAPTDVQERAPEAVVTPDVNAPATPAPATPSPTQQANAQPVQAQRAPAPAAPAQPAAQAANIAPAMEAPAAQPVAPQAAPFGDSVADKLRRIRAVATPALGTTAASSMMSEFDAEDSEAEESFYAEDEHAHDFLSETAADLDAALAEDDESEDNLKADTDVPIDQGQTQEAVEDDATAAASTDVSAEAVDDDHDMLARFSASNDDFAQEETTPASDMVDETDNAEISAQMEDADDTDTDDADDELTNLLNSISAQSHDDNDADDDGLGDDIAEQDSSDSAEDTLSQLLADALGQDAPAPADKPTADVQDDDQPSEDTSETTDIAPLRARVVKMKRADLDAVLAGDTLDAEEDDDSDVTSSLSPQAEAELQRELAEVEAELRQTRTILENDAPDATSDIDQIDAITANIASLTAPESEDVQQADDANTSATSDIDSQADDLDSDSLEDDDSQGDDTPEVIITPKRAVRLDKIGTDAQAPRIFDEAASQLEEPESNKRRSAIQHLRAAVAATKAERNAGGAMARDVDDQPYRMDLESAVRPRRPQAIASNASRSERPVTTRPAPLKLVAEQRIDAPAQPVRPRRISRADLESRARPTTGAASARPTPNEPAHDAAPSKSSPKQTPQAAQGSFGEFAENMGARGLTDLLEAAAAYMSDVEGMEQFSRPMLMQKLREVDQSEFTREEGLRSFGQLLRQGKLQKLKGGRFAVTDETEFRQSA